MQRIVLVRPHRSPRHRQGRLYENVSNAENLAEVVLGPDLADDPLSEPTHEGTPLSVLAEREMRHQIERVLGSAVRTDMTRRERSKKCARHRQRLLLGQLRQG